MAVTNPLWPFFNLELRNDVQVSDRVYEFDIYLTHTGNYSTPVQLELSSIQLGILFNNLVLNGGTAVATVVPGSQNDMNSIQRQTDSYLSVVGPNTLGLKTIKITSKPAGSAGAGTIISTTTGSRIMRVRLTNSVAFSLLTPNLGFSFLPTASWPTTVSAYIDGFSRNVNVNGTFITNGLVNPVFAPGFNMTGSGAYCPTGSALTIGLDGSQLGASYQLRKDGIAYGSPVLGTGTALSWTGITDAGVYTCISGTVNMNGSAIITVATPLVPSATINADNMTVCEGNAINFSSSTSNGGANPTYNWYFAGVLQASHLPTIQYNGPSSFFDVFLEMTSNATCVTTSLATSNTLSVSVNPLPAPPISGGNVVACASVLPATLVDIVPTGFDVKWYDAAVAGNLLASTANYITSLPGTYYNEAINPSTGCISSTRTAVSLTVNANPAPPVSGGDVTVCANLLPATLIDIVPSGMEVKWFDAATGGNFLYAGANLSASLPGVYYNETYDPATTCSSTTRTAVTLTVNSNPAPPTSGGDVVVCANAVPAILVDIVPAGIDVKWYDAATNGNFLFAGANYVTSTPGIYYNEAYNPITGCTSLTRTAVSLTVNPMVTPTVSVTPSANPVIAGTPVTFTAIVQVGYTMSVSNWYVNSAYQTGSTLSFLYTPANGETVTFSAQFNEACALNNSGSVVMTVNPAFNPTTTFTGVGNWNDASKWSFGIPVGVSKANIQGTCTVTADAVCRVLNVNSTSSITINSGVNLNVSDSIVAFSDATGSAAIVQLGNLTAGLYTQYQRYVTAAKSHLISSPLTSAKSGVFNGSYLTMFNESTNIFAPNITNSTVLLGVGKGYSLYSTTNKTFKFVGGTLNKGDQTVSLQFSGPSFGNNLIGNPYPCRLNGNIDTWSKNNVSNAIQVYDPIAGSYLTWNGSLGTLPNGIIAETQGFFVKAIGPGASITIPEASETSLYSNSFKSIVNNQIRLDISGNGFADGMFVYFNQDATNGLDYKYDVEKEFGSIDAPQIFSITPDNNLSINCLPEVSSTLSVPLGLKVGANTSYTITASELQSFNAGTQIYLEDLKAKKMINLNQDASYTFDANTNDMVNRFTLHFGTPTSNSTVINAYAFDNTIYVSNPSLANINEVVVYNSLGQIVTSFKPEITSLKGYRINTAAGSYIVKIVADNKVVSNKINLK